MSFNESRVEHQVKYLGLLENVKVKRAGYAYRHYKNVFLNRFGILLEPNIPTSIPDFVAGICRMHKELNPEEFEEGKTKIFVRNPETIFTLEELLFRKMDPEGYKERVRAYKESEKQAMQKAGKHSLKPKCLVM